MSRSIFIILSLNVPFFSQCVSDFLFSVVEEGCKRHIAVSFPDNEEMHSYKETCYLGLSDSYNFSLVSPLIGNDEDAEVIEYRPKPLHDRLQNLQGLLSMILCNDLVEKMETCFTMNYDIDDLEIIDADIAEFADIMPSILGKETEHHFKLVWNNQKA